MEALHELEKRIPEVAHLTHQYRELKQSLQTRLQSELDCLKEELGRLEGCAGRGDDWSCQLYQRLLGRKERRFQALFPERA